MNVFINALNHGGELWWRYALHVAWQATLLALVVLIVVRLARRWPSPLRYWLLIIALVKFAMPPLLHAPVGLFSQVGPQLAPRQADQVTVLASAETLRVPEVGTAPALPLPDPAATQPSVVDEAVEPDLSEESTEPEAAMDLAPPPVALGETTQPLNETAQQPGPAIVSSTDHSAAPVARARLRWQAWLLVAHVLGIAAVAAWTLWQVFALRRTVRRARAVTDGELYERFLGLWRAMSLRRAPRLLVSPEPIAPMVIGVVRPTVVVPAAAKALAGGDLDAMLTHELAHVRRRDTWLNWFQIVVVAVWWFNPVIWFLSRAIRKVREDCCDDLVLSRGHSTDDAYCQTLLHAASRLAVSSPIGARLGFADRLHPLGRRIRRIMDRTLRRAPALSLWGVLLVALLAVVLLPGLGRRGETTEPETEKQTEQAESQEPALEPAESSARTPELDKLEMEVAAQEKALADQFDAAADLKHKQIESIEARRKMGVLSNRQAGEQIAQIVRETAENRLRAAELRLSAAERELSILRLSVPPGGALPDAAREKTEKIKSLRSEVKSKQYDFAAGIDYVVKQRENWIKEVQAKLRAGLLPETEANIKIVNLRLLNTQDKILAAKLRYLAESNLTYSADVFDIETRRAVVEPGSRSGPDEVLHWETLLLEAKAELIRHEDEWGTEHPKRKAQEKIIALYEAKLEEARKQAALGGGDSLGPLAGPVEPGSRPELNDALLDAAKEGNLAGVESLIERGAYVSTRDDKNNTPLDWALVNDYEEVAVYLIEHGADVNAHLPLYWAATRGHKKAAALLIAKGADLNAAAATGDTPLVQAVVNGHADIAQLLLDKGAHLDPSSLRNRGVFNRVASAGYLDCARLLIENGVHPNGVSLYRVFLSAGGEQLAEYGPPGETPLMAAARSGQIDMLGLLLEKGATLDVAATGPDHQPLLEAVKSGQIKAVAFLLDKGADPNARDGRGRHLLHFALDYRTPRVGGDPGAVGPPAEEFIPQAVKLLIKHGADVNARDANAQTPLHLATQRSLSEVIEILVAAGADVEARASQGQTPLHLAIEVNDTDSVRSLVKAGADPNADSVLEHAIRKSNTEIVKLLLDRGAEPNRRLSGGETLLEYAAARGRLEIVKLLLDAGADASTGQPLAGAVSKPDKKIVKLLLTHGADPNRRSTHGTTPLQRAARDGSTEIAELLLDAGAEVNARDVNGETALYGAAYNGRQKVAELLLTRGADPNLKHAGGKAPLQVAVERKHYRVIELLVSKGAEVADQDGKGRRPLTVAAAAGDLKATKILLAAGADINAKDRDGQTPLGRATEHKHKEVVDALLAAGADPNLPSAGVAPLLLTVPPWQVQYEIAAALIAKGADVNAKDSNGDTILHHAVHWRAEELLKLVLASRADVNAANAKGLTPLHVATSNVDAVIGKMLLDSGADVHVKDGDGNTLLDRAVGAHAQELVKLLLARGADVNAANVEGLTPLHRATMESDEVIIKILLDAGAEIDAKDMQGFTPLHHAAKAGYRDTAKVLLEAGADVEAKDIGSLTPLLIAAEHGRHEVAELLLAKGADANARTLAGQTPLFRAAGRRWEQGPVVQTCAVLIDGGADVNAQDQAGSTPLHAAARANRSDAVRLLLDNGADPTRADNNGRTPADYAGGSARLRRLLEAAAGEDKDNPGE